MSTRITIENLGITPYASFSPLDSRCAVLLRSFSTGQRVHLQDLVYECPD